MGKGGQIKKGVSLHVTQLIVYRAKSTTRSYYSSSPKSSLDKSPETSLPPRNFCVVSHFFFLSMTRTETIL